jgi:hypothetical protein
VIGFEARSRFLGERRALRESYSVYFDSEV